MEIKEYLNTVNCNVKQNRDIKYIVVHYTSNNGDTALNNCRYFQEYRGASAHYFVDENSIYRSVADNNIAWHCGTKGTYYHKSCRNANSIGVEMCSRIGADRNTYYIKAEVVDKTVELVKWLMDKYNVPAENVIRHYDVTHKNCPEPFVRDVLQWESFKNRLEKYEMTTSEKAEFEALKKAVVENKAEADAIINKMGAEIAQLKSSMVYNYVDDNMPSWAKQDVQNLMDWGILKGTDTGLNLDGMKLWVCVMLGRTINFIKKLI